MHYQITASIVAYRSSPDELLHAMESFLQSKLTKHLIIIDHSPDDRLKKYCLLENTEYEHHPENRGYGAGHNIAINKIIDKSDYHVVLNPDTYFEYTVIPTIFNYMEEHRSVGQLMPNIVDKEGITQHLAKLLPTPLDLIFKRFLPKSFVAKRMKKFRLVFTGYNKIMNVPYLSGCCMFFRTSSLKKIGLFDERFFMYPEDIDITRRMHQYYETIFFPNATIVHKHEASSYKSFKMLRIHIWNMIKYFNKWGWWFDKDRKTINKRTLQNLGYNNN